jgi:UMF1 family MFS transporter
VSAPVQLTGETPEQRRALWAWALYDFANSAFATTVMAGFYPVFFKQYWSAGVPAAQSTWRLGAANSIASLIVALIAPMLGAVADRSPVTKKLLLGFAALGVVTTAGLGLVGHGDWWNASVLYTAACVGFAASIALYDALIVAIASEHERDRASSLGYALGYLGGGVLFALNVVMTLQPHWFGLADAAQAVRASFVLVALWWGVFSVPLALRVPEPNAGELAPLRAALGGVRQLGSTLRKVAGLRNVWLFLLAYWLYIDGVDTVIRMAVDYGLSLGLQSKSLMIALLIVQFVGFPAAIAYGRLGSKIGTKRAIALGIGVYIGVTVMASLMRTAAEFYALAVVIGLVQGGVQALSRSLFSRLIPEREAAELFGFYNMLGKFAAILGPVLMGWVAVLTGSARLSILSISLLLIAGGGLLLLVRDTRASEASPGWR